MGRNEKKHSQETSFSGMNEANDTLGENMDAATDELSKTIKRKTWQCGCEDGNKHNTKWEQT